MKRWVGVAAVCLLLIGVGCRWFLSGAGDGGDGTAGDEDVQAAFDKAHGIKPKTTQKPKLKAEGRKMADLVVVGAGIAAANGTYAESGTYGGKPTYTNGSRWIWFATSYWYISFGVGSTPEYWTPNATLPGTPWLVYEGYGVAPAPTVSVSEYTISIELSGQARAYLAWVRASDKMTVGGTAIRDDGTALGVSSVEYSFDEGAAFHTQSTNPTATSIALAAARTKAQLGALSPGSHTLHAKLYRGGGNWIVSGAFDANLNGTYAPGGTWAEKTYYQNAGGFYLFWSPVPNRCWVISNSLRNLDFWYRGETDTELPGGTWAPVVAPPPAPAVATSAALIAEGTATFDVVAQEFSLAAADATLDVGETGDLVASARFWGTTWEAARIALSNIPDYEAAAPFGSDHFGLTATVRTDDGAADDAAADIPASYTYVDGIDAEATGLRTLYLIGYNLDCKTEDDWAVLATGTYQVTRNVPTPTDPAPGPDDPGGGDVTPPVLAIVAPVEDALLDGPFSVVVECTDAGSGVREVRMYSAWDDETILTEPNLGTQYRFPSATGTYGTADIAPGDIFVAVAAQDNARNSAAASVTCHRPGTGSGGDEDTTAPAVAILTPANGASLQGLVTVDVVATDANGVARVHIELGGIRQGEILYAPNATATDGTRVYRWIVDVDDWVDGSYGLCAYAYDQAGNLGSAGAAITIAHSMAGATVAEFFGPVGDDDGVAEDGRLAMLCLEVPDPPSDPRRRYNVRCGLLRGRQSRSWADYTPIPVEQSFGLAGSGTYEIAVLRQPQVVESSWDSGSVSIAKVVELQDGLVAALCVTPNKVRKFGTATGFVDWVDVGAVAPNDMVVLGDKVYIATGDHLRVFDADTGELAYTISQFGDDVITSVDRLAVDADAVYIAATVGTGATLYKLSHDYASLTTLATLAAPCSALAMLRDVLFVGDTAGHIYRYNSATLTLEATTGENHIEAFCLAGDVVYAGTGNSGHIHQRASMAWSELIALPVTEARAVAVFGGWLHAGGNAGGIYRQDDDLQWAQAYVLDDATAINWMQSTLDEATGIEMLLIATDGTPTARMYRIERSPGSGLVSGPGDVSLAFQILQRA